MKVSEYFFSIQGEGRNTGMPTFFIRLSRCNLLCGGRGTIKDKKLHDGATWRCDSIESWIKGKEYKYKELIVELEKLESLKGNNIIFTGGEPLMQQIEIGGMIDELKDFRCTYEIETNGTIKPDPYLIKAVSQWNVSPKLSNSGMPKKKRIKNDVLEYFKMIGADFKFVISRDEDVKEIYHDFVLPLNLNNRNIYLMPAASDQKELKKNGILVAELCKKLGCNFSNRLQIQIWNQTLGV